jgi:CHAD domain-containing protein
MRFSDFAIYHALQENNRCLHLLSAYPAPLSDTSVHSLRIGVKRLRASWRLLQREVPETMWIDAEARLKAIHRTLAPARDELAVLTIARSLAAKTTKKKSRAALELVAQTLGGHGAGVLTRASMDQVSDGFQQESGVWRDLDVETLHDQALIGGFVRSYQRGRRLGRRALDHDDAAVMHRWRGWVKTTFYQLDMIRPVLCASNRARRWYLDRLGDALGKHHDLLLLRARIGDVALDEADRLRVEMTLETQLTVYRDRARKLHPYIYAQKGAVFGEAVAADIARLSFDNVVVLPRSA